MSDRLRVILHSAPPSVSLTRMKEAGDLYWQHSSPTQSYTVCVGLGGGAGVSGFGFFKGAQIKLPKHHLLSVTIPKVRLRVGYVLSVRVMTN